MIAEAINKPGGHVSMNLQLIETYVDRVSELYEQADVSIVPAELARMEGFFAGIDQVAQTIKGGGR